MQNPFESGHIKNYLLFYGSVVVIMILFFIATSLFHEVKQQQKKEFAVQERNGSEVITELQQGEETQKNNSAPKFQLLDKAY